MIIISYFIVIIMVILLFLVFYPKFFSIIILNIKYIHHIIDLNLNYLINNLSNFHLLSNTYHSII